MKGPKRNEDREASEDRRFSCETETLETILRQRGDPRSPRFLRAPGGTEDSIQRPEPPVVRVDAPNRPGSVGNPHYDDVNDTREARLDFSSFLGAGIPNVIAPEKENEKSGSVGVHSFPNLWKKPESYQTAETSKLGNTRMALSEH